MFGLALWSNGLIIINNTVIKFPFGN